MKMYEVNVEGKVLRTEFNLNGFDQIRRFVHEHGVGDKCYKINVIDVKNEDNMKLYKRVISKREAINKYGKLGYKWYTQYVLTDDITPFNYKKRIYFEQIVDEQIIERCKELNLEPNQIKEVEIIRK